MIKTIEYNSKIGDIVRSTFHELEHLRNITESCKSKFLNYFQRKLVERYFLTLYNCFQSNIDHTDIYNVDILYSSAIKYVKDAMQCTENSFIFLVLNDYLEMLTNSYSEFEKEMSAMPECSEKLDAKAKDNDVDTKPETNQKNEHNTAKCEYCLAVFEYNDSELEEEEDLDMRGYHYHYYAKCPKCGNRILVKSLI